MMVGVTTRMDEERHDAALQPDELVGELTRVLPDLAVDVMANEADIKAAVGKSELDPREVGVRLIGRADEVLRFTNREIALLRDAITSLLSLEGLPQAGTRPDGSVRWRSRLFYARVGIGLWLIAAWPVAVWQ